MQLILYWLLGALVTFILKLVTAKLLDEYINFGRFIGGMILSLIFWPAEIIIGCVVIILCILALSLHCVGLVDMDRWIKDKEDKRIE